MVGWLVGGMAPVGSWFVGELVGRLVVGFICWLVGWLGGSLVGWYVGWLGLARNNLLGRYPAHDADRI